MAIFMHFNKILRMFTSNVVFIVMYIYVVYNSGTPTQEPTLSEQFIRTVCTEI